MQGGPVGMKTRKTVERRDNIGTQFTKGSLLLGLQSILLACVVWQPMLQAATVTTDFQDYPPFSYVGIRGTGFQPGETVNNQVVEIAGPAAGTAYEPWTVQAGSDGSFTTSWYVFSYDLLGTTLQLTSTGQSSGLTATQTFSDGSTLTCPGVTNGIAPISPPNGGFSIDGDLVANTPTGGIGDWLPGALGSGGSVLDASGCPLDPSTTYHLLDAADSAQDDNFQSGKADDDPNTWSWAYSPVGDKVDLKHALIHTAKDSSGQQWVVVGATRQSNNGDAYVDFEFLQNALTLTNDANGHGGFSSAGPNGGRTINDFVLAITLTGGGTTPNLCVFRWNQVGVDNHGNLLFDYTNATASLPANSVFGAMNTAPVSIPNCYSNTLDTYDVNDFGEVSVDITALISGFDPCTTESI